MGLDILSKLKPTVPFEVDFLSGHDGARTQFAAQTVFLGYAVEPEHTRLSHFNNQPRWNLLEWQCVVYCSNPLLNGPNVPFNIPNVLVTRRIVESHAHACQIPAQVRKFSIHECYLDNKPTASVDLDNCLYTL